VAKVKRKRPVKVGGYVWCDFHCSIHSNIIDYFEENVADKCNDDAWRPVYVWALPNEGRF
jgi:hypothetical protein